MASCMGSGPGTTQATTVRSSSGGRPPSEAGRVRVDPSHSTYRQHAVDRMGSCKEASCGGSTGARAPGCARVARLRKDSPASGDIHVLGRPGWALAGDGSPVGPKWPEATRRVAPDSRLDCMTSDTSSHEPATVGTHRDSRWPSSFQLRKTKTSWALVHSFHRRKRSSRTRVAAGRGPGAAGPSTGGSKAKSSPPASKREIGAARGRGAGAAAAGGEDGCAAAGGRCVVSGDGVAPPGGAVGVAATGAHGDPAGQSSVASSVAARAREGGPASPTLACCVDSRGGPWAEGGVSRGSAWEGAVAGSLGDVWEGDPSASCGALAEGAGRADVSVSRLVSGAAERRARCLAFLGARLGGGGGETSAPSPVVAPGC